MAKEIIWNRTARNNLRNIIIYLNSEWGESVTEDFVVRVDELVDTLSVQPEIGRIEESTKKPIRRAFITKHSTLFYTIGAKSITLVSIFDNRQNPKKKRL